jgi:hypothetical protein
MVTASAGDEPQGILLRKGIVKWTSSLTQARPFIETDVRPKSICLLRDCKPPGFRCERESARGVVHCSLACCVDLGEKNTLQFATLWFYNDQFYAFDVSFGTLQFGPLDAAMTNRFGPPSRQTEATLTVPNFVAGGINTYVAMTRRWEAGDTVILLSDRGGEGKPLVGHVFVAHMPLYRQAVPPDNAPPTNSAKLPF